MRCKYCFYSDVAENREVKSRGIMSLDTLETIVKKALSESKELCVFGFQGGEPTLAGLDFFKALITFEKKHNINNVKITHALQTNGLCIDESWAAFFKENDFLLGISIDAGKHIHDNLRLDMNGEGTHLKCLKATKHLSDAGAQFNILSVITKQLALYPEKVYKFYSRENFRYIQFIPCIDGWAAAESTREYSLQPRLYGKFLCKIFDLWYEDYIRGKFMSIRMFDNYINMLAGHPPENCAMRGSCTAYPLIEADGSVYPCDFYALDEYLLGNIKDYSFSELLSNKAAKDFVDSSLVIHSKCAKCRYFSICRGGCRRDRDSGINKDNPLKLNRFCESYKIFFDYALNKMKDIVKQPKNNNF